jgi:hypothetical protein
MTINMECRYAHRVPSAGSSSRVSEERKIGKETLEGVVLYLGQGKVGLGVTLGVIFVVRDFSQLDISP